MSRTHVKNGIEQRANTNLRIGEELADIVEFLISNGHVPGGSTIKTPTLRNACTAATYQRVERLHNEMGMVLKFKQGPNTYVIHTRLNRIVNGRGASSMVNKELRRVAQHARQNATIRQIVAATRSVPVGQALQNLFQGNFAIRRDRLERIVNEIQADSRVNQGDYGKIIFRTPANLYRASSLAVQVYNR